jgi:hypothetical protein
VPLGKEVAEIDIQMPLTEEQKQGRQIVFELPAALNSFHFDHIPALMGMCWNSQNLPETALVPLDEADEKEIEETFKGIIENPEHHRQIPALLASFRAAGACIFSFESNFAEDNPLYDYLTLVPVPMVEETVFTIPHRRRSETNSTKTRRKYRTGCCCSCSGSTSPAATGTYCCHIIFNFK